jgi:hypothetical protein
MHLTVLALAPIEFALLAPAPSVNECQSISELLQTDTTEPITDLMAGPLIILSTYRGSMFYCAGGVKVHRIKPTSTHANGFISMPDADSEEEVHISTVNGRYAARVRFEKPGQYF